MPELTEGAVYLCTDWLEDVICFQHRSVQSGNYCTILQTNPNLSKYTSVNYSCKQLLVVVLGVFFQKTVLFSCIKYKEIWVT